jgi:carboxypeptidase Taq
MTDKAKLKPVAEPAEGYNDLKFYFSNLNTLFSIRGTLAVDMMTAMPTGGLQRRINDISAITKRIYAETTTPAVTKLLEQVENAADKDSSNWSEWDLANLREMRRIYSHLAALPPDLYIASVQVANEGRKRHAAAKLANDWSQTAPYVQQVVDLYRRVAELKQKTFGTDTLYRALLLGYASDIGTTKIDPLYDNLLEPLSKLRNEALEKQKSQPAPLPLDGDFSRGDQMWLNRTVLEMMGFDFDRGALLVTSLSPMMGGSPDDARILVRCGENNTFLDSLEDTLYQGARGLYMQNLPADWRTQPVGQDMGTLMNNSLSILYETIIGRTPQFFEFIAVRAEGVFRQFKNKSFEPENLYRLKKIITDTPVRNNADELSKIFHDLLRYRIEKDLINGNLAVKDLPERWNEESRKLLGKTPQNLSEGALQNPDWFSGRFGFIATNTLSHIVAAQLQDKLFTELNDLPDNIQHGNLRPAGEWLKQNIHSKGRSVGTMEMLESVTGSPVSEKFLLKHLERRYLSDKH